MAYLWTLYNAPVANGSWVGHEVEAAVVHWRDDAVPERVMRVRFQAESKEHAENVARCLLATYLISIDAQQEGGTLDAKA